VAGDRTFEVCFTDRWCDRLVLAIVFKSTQSHLGPSPWRAVMAIEKSNTPEKLHTIKEAAGYLNLPYWKLQRAVKADLVRSYTLLNSRRLVRLSEVVQFIESSRLVGNDHA
jgi:hypothetical protein